MNRLVKYAYAAPIVVAGTIALAGCGGSSSSSSAAVAPGADFVAQATKICDDVNSQVAALPKVVTSADLLTTGAEEVRLGRAGVAKLGTLTPPAGQKPATDRWIATLRHGSVLTAELLTAVKAGDAAKLKQLVAEGKASNASGNAQARHLGLASCAKDVRAGSAKSG